MDAIADHRVTSFQDVIRDKRGVVVGQIEYQKLTGKSVARDARGRVIGVYDPREGLTREASGKVVAQGNLLVGLLRPW
jgi:hypothetical protein